MMCPICVSNSMYDHMDCEDNGSKANTDIDITVTYTCQQLLIW